MMTPKKTYYFGNWKMNGSIAMIQKFFREFEGFTFHPYQEIALFVPFPYLLPMQGLFTTLGAQDCSIHEQGSFTGDVSATMLKELGVSYVLVGHSERRQHYKEGLSTLTKKCHHIQAKDMIPVICLGESLEERQEGITLEIIQNQIQPFLGYNAPKIFAYEPLWAIGTGLTAGPEELTDVFSFLKTLTKEPLLYGGSVTSFNARGILSLPLIDGVLVGGASLDPYSWKTLIETST